MSDEEIPVINLAEAPGEGDSWGRSKTRVYLWGAAELLFVYNPWQVSSKLRAAVLRAFGAKVGKGVILRPRLRVRFPWNLVVGDRSWIGEGVWIHNQTDVRIGSDVVISQETMVTTGSHRIRKDMGLILRPIVVEDGAWITARCLILGGTIVGRSAVVRPMTVVRQSVPPNTVYDNDGVIESRFR